MPNAPVSIPLYVAAAVVQSAGLAAVSFQLGQITFALFTILLTFIGAFTSFMLRRAGAPPRLLKTGALVLGLIFFFALRGEGIFGALVPPEETGSSEMLLVSALAFTATFASFLLLTDEAVIFTCVWAIAMIGLTGTVNINSELPICFVVFLGAASFLLVHQNALSFGGDAEAPIGQRLVLPRWSLVRTHLMMGGAAWLMSLLLGVVIAIPVQMVGRNMSLGSIIQRLRVSPSATAHIGGTPHLIFDNPQQFNVGLGPVDDDPTERLAVWSTRPQYWRGRTYDVYDGHGWSSSYTERPPDIPGDPKTQARNGDYIYDLSRLYRDDPPRLKTERISNTFHVSSGTYGPIYHAADAKIVRTPLFRIFVRPDHTLSGGRGLSTDYSVDSDITLARPSDLRRSSHRYPEGIASKYLVDLGPFYSEALHDLSIEATAGIANTPYDRASAIRRFVAARCVYTREARAVPKDRDAAEFFLNESREGYCDLYATAMAVLCRYAGLPARVVTGFAPGLQAADDDQPKPGGPSDTRKRYILRGSDQHAWTEVYFTGYGWVVFDATIDTGGVAPIKQTADPVEKKKNPFPWQRVLPIVLLGLGVALLAFVVVTEVRGRHTVARERLASGIMGPDREAEKVFRAYLAAVRRLNRRGKGSVAYHSSGTTGEYLAAVRATLGDDIGNALEPLTRLTEKALFSPSRLTPGDTETAQQTLVALTETLKRTLAPAKSRRPLEAAATPNDNGKESRS